MMTYPLRFIVYGLTPAIYFALCFGQIPRAWAELPPLIARDVLFGNPEKIAPQLSPDGRWLAWIAPDKGVFCRSGARQWEKMTIES
jgi:hypothetical protein